MNQEGIQLILQLGNNFMLGVLTAAGLCSIILTFLLLIIHYLKTNQDTNT